ncbi:AsmA family protein [Rhizobiaceae bacterium n13]|uniref:AsmA family protein n=1 Tax=Ferirhizobium litorale TaxID=2927786 RepID=A0AAE3U535_9HYPH|nr:AsmA family protein [Fererhizobium litorale]MDI7863827.1 AsmA family protein [Fererhizobium litorale]MDI7924073.1 AsmA family protein [Fererhizobium litorale]
MLGRILVFLGGLLVVLLFAALLAPLFVDWTNFRREFEEQASRIIGKKVVVYGAVDARILPFPSVTLHDVRVGQDPDGTPLIQVAEFSMDAELAPFLSGEALIFDMRIERPKARIRLLKDGTLDWMRGSRPEIPAKTVVLENVQVSGGEIEFIDEQSGRTRRVTDLNAAMTARSLAGPWRIEGNAALDGNQGGFSFATSAADDVDGAIRLVSRLSPERQPVTVDLEGELRVVSGKPSYSGKFTAGLVQAQNEKDKQKKSPGPRLRGAFQLTNERIRVPEYRLEVGALDDPYVVTGEATLDTGKLPEFLLTADGQQINVNRIGNNGSSGKTDRDSLMSARQRLSALIAMAADVPVPQVPGRATLRLPAIVIGDTTIRDARIDLRPAGNGWTVDNAVAILPGRTQIEAKGNLILAGEPSFNGSLLLASSQPTGLSSWLTGSVDPAIRKLQAAGFSAEVNLGPHLQRFENLELAVGKAKLEGKIERQALPDQPANLSIELSGDEVDIDALRALAGLFAGDQTGMKLFDHQIAAHLKAGKLNALGVSANNVETVFTVSGGALSLERLTIGDVSGAAMTAIGKAEGSLSDIAGTGKLTFRAADPGPFLAMLRDRLPRHPAIDRLVRNASWYADADMRLTVSLVRGDEGGLQVKMNGTANRSRINLDYQLSDILAFGTDGTMSLQATLENPSTSILLGQAGLDPLPVDADANGLLAVQMHMSGSDPADTTLTFRTDQTSLSANGKIDMKPADFPNGQMKLALESRDIEPYLLMHAVAVPQFGTGVPVSLAGDLAINADRIELANIAGKVVENTVNGVLALDRKGPDTKVGGKLDLASVDAAWLAEAVYGPLTDPTTGELATTALGSSAFGGLELNLQLSSKQFWPGIFGSVQDFHTGLAYKGDELTLNDISGSWSGGQLTGRLLMANSEGNGFLQSRIDVTEGDTAAISWQSGGEPVATGRFGLTLSTEASGNTLEEIVAGATGSGEIRLTDTKVKGLNLDVLKPLIAAVDLMEGEINTEKVQPIVETLLDNGEAVLGGVTIPFNITEGRARAQGVVAESDLARISGAAEIDLDARMLEGSLALLFNAGNDAQAGADAGIRISYKGDLAAPERTLDVTDITNFLAMRAFERERHRVEKLQANVLEKQRLRREAALYKAREREREEMKIKAARDEKLRIEVEALRKRLADEKIAEEARQRAAAEAARELQQLPAPFVIPDPGSETDLFNPATPAMPVTPNEKVIRGELPPVRGMVPDMQPQFQ